MRPTCRRSFGSMASWSLKTRCQTCSSRSCTRQEGGVSCVCIGGRAQRPLTEGYTRLQASNVLVRLNVVGLAGPANVGMMRMYNHTASIFTSRRALTTPSRNRTKKNMQACDDIMDQVFQADPEGSFGGGAGKLPHRSLAFQCPRHSPP